MKDSFYFPHDFHARHDPKLERLRMTIGCEGVGIFWCLVEMLYEEGGSLPIQDIEIYSKALNCKLDTLLKTLREYNLFVENKTHFWSPTLIKRLKHITSKREKARASAKLSHSANAERTLSERSAIKESKGKESKESISIPPTIEEVTTYCFERKNSVDPKNWFNHYEAKGWMIGKNKMVNWRAAVRTWEKTEKKEPYRKPL